MKVSKEKYFCHVNITPPNYDLKHSNGKVMATVPGDNDPMGKRPSLLCLLRKSENSLFYGSQKVSVVSASFHTLIPPAMQGKSPDSNS